MILHEHELNHDLNAAMLDAQEPLITPREILAACELAETRPHRTLESLEKSPRRLVAIKMQEERNKALGVKLLAAKRLDEAHDRFLTALCEYLLDEPDAVTDPWFRHHLLNSLGAEHPIVQDFFRKRCRQNRG